MLKLASIRDDPNCRVSREIEELTTGVVSIHYVVQRDFARPPLHWRAGKWDKPPVDIRVDPVDGQLRAVQVVIQHPLSEKSGATPKAPRIRRGVPFFDLGAWQGGKPYLDETTDVGLSWFGGATVAVDFGHSLIEADLECRVGSGLQLLFDRAELLIGYLISDLTSAERSLVRNAQ